MPKVKSKQLSKQEYAKEFRLICKGKDDFHAHYICCNDEVNLTSMGKASISIHQKTPKHMQNARGMQSTQSLSAFLPSLSVPTAMDDKTAAAGGSWSFHVACHNQWFQSTDCVSSNGLFCAMFPDSYVAKKFSCAQTKTVKIIKSVLAPYSVELFFSLCGVQWTDERNLLQVKTVKSLVQTKIDFDLNCLETYRHIVKEN